MSEREPRLEKSRTVDSKFQLGLEVKPVVGTLDSLNPTLTFPDQPNIAIEVPVVHDMEYASVSQLEATRRNVVQLLDKVCDILESNTLEDQIRNQALDRLFLELNQFRTRVTPNEWMDLKYEHILTHRLTTLLHLDPCTRRSYEKPRGYAGDAKLLDYLYKNFYGDQYGVLERGFLEYVTDRPAGYAVRERLKIIANILDQVTSKKEKSRVLSIASGHSRELEYAQNIDRIQEFVAVDQDSRSLEFVKQSRFSSMVTPIQDSFVSLIQQKHEYIGKFDCVYASGLFDYLSDKLAIKLVQYMFSVLNPGGTLLVTNFTPASEDIGYMETFMDWNLIYRSFDQMEGLAVRVNSDQIQEKKVFRGKNRNIVYLQIEKA
jgi:extracellular factor (EF) 3-hydroxypalmitic acid methyl ester biosynthesis protein